MAGFVAEFIIFSGAYDEHPIATLFGIFGVVLSAGYLLWTMQRVFYGPPKERWDGLTDATAWWERAPVVLLAASIVVVGVYPSFLVDIISDGVEPIVGRRG
jgi:NADH-quinone oxidoreductase subunit M